MDCGPIQLDSPTFSETAAGYYPLLPPPLSLNVVHSTMSGVVTGYHPPLPPPPHIDFTQLQDDNESLAEATVRLQNLIEVFHCTLRWDLLQDIALRDFQRAFLEGLSIFANSGLLDHSLNINPSGFERLPDVFPSISIQCLPFCTNPNCVYCT